VIKKIQNTNPFYQRLFLLLTPGLPSYFLTFPSIIPDLARALSFLNHLFMHIEAIPSQSTKHIWRRSMSRCHHMLISRLRANWSHPRERRCPIDLASCFELFLRVDSAHESTRWFAFQETWETLGEGLDTLEDFDDYFADSQYEVPLSTIVVVNAFGNKHNAPSYSGLSASVTAFWSAGILPQMITGIGLDMVTMSLMFV